MRRRMSDYLSWANVGRVAGALGLGVVIVLVAVAQERERSERDRGERRERGRESAERREGGERTEARAAELRKVLEGLERGVGALRALHKFDEAERLNRIADGVRRELQGAPQRREGDERAVAQRQLEVMKLALPALREAKRGDSAELLQRAIRAREVTLEGRRDEEAQAIRNRAPKLGAQAEIVGFAARLWREYGNADRAEALGALAKQLQTQSRRQQPERSARREGEQRERRGGDRPQRDRERPAEREGRDQRRRGDEAEAARRQVEIMKMAQGVLAEAKREDAADILKRAIQAIVVDLERMEGEEARIVRQRRPSAGNQVEALGLAAKILKESGRVDKAGQVAELAERMRRSDRRD